MTDTEQVLSLALWHWDDLNRKYPSDYLIKSFCHLRCANKNFTRLDWWNQMPVSPARGNPTQIHPVLLDYHMRSETSAVGEYDWPQGSCSKCGAKDKKKERRKEQADQLSLLFVSPHYRTQDWGFLFSVSNRDERWSPPFFRCVCVSTVQSCMCHTLSQVAMHHTPLTRH